MSLSRAPRRLEHGTPLAKASVMNRHLALLLVLPVGVFVACSSSPGAPESPTPPGTAAPGDGAGGSSGGGGPTTPSPGATPEELTRNPVTGVGPAVLVLDTGAFTDGPIWSPKEGVLFFTAPLGEGGLYRMKPDGSAMKVRDGNRANGELPIGNTLDRSGALFTVEAKRITRASAATDAGAPSTLATGYPSPEAGLATFDTLNDAVVSANGTIYATDPGYFAAPIANRIYRITPAGVVTVVEAFEDVPRPNGIALSPDGKNLYVGFTQPIQGTKPFIRRYSVAADGVLGEHMKFVEFDADQAPDGIEVDLAGNLFVATKAGITVFTKDGARVGVIAVPEVPTGMAFGGADLKTLYVTTQGTKIFQLTMNVTGIVQ
jgi:gluconolactonase